MSEFLDGTGLAELCDNIKTYITNQLASYVPTGVVQAFAGSNTPNGWLLCDGSAVSRTDYAELYSVIGDTYGAGDGSTTFNLPNLIDKFVQGNATAGTEKQAGLPNITGDFAVRKLSDGETPITTQANGSFYSLGSGIQTPRIAATAGNAISDYRTGFDASRSSSIYGNATTVQPPALTMRYVIKY